MATPARSLLGRVRALVLAAAALGALPARAVEVRDVLGVAHAAGRYNFTADDYLNEGADQILETGSRVIKVFVYPGHMPDLYLFNSTWAPDADAVALVQTPYFQRLFAKPFTTYILDVTPVTSAPQFLDGLSPEEAAAERDQMYRLTQYLITAYADTGKTFVLQNWEGDHLLRDRLADGVDPGPVRIQGMIDWWNARQDGVTAARRELRPHGVDVVHGCEVNFLAAAMAGKVTATNDVVPHTQCDLYSYSSWDVDFDADGMVKALDYLQSKAPPSHRFGRHNVYVGEYGMSKTHGAPEGQRFERIRALMEAALGWGARWAVYWEVYCNEPLQPPARGPRPTNADMRGFWLVRPDGGKAPMWNVLVNQSKASLQRGAFSSFANQYLAVHPGDGATLADRWVRGNPWSLFTIKDWTGGALQSGDTVTLQSHDGLYLTVEPGAGGRVYARSATPGLPEKLVLRKVGGTGIIQPGDSVVFQVRDGRFLGIEVGTGALRARRSAPGPAEIFTFRGEDE